MKKIIDDVNAPLSHKLAGLSSSAPANQAKLQDDARATTIIDGLDRAPQFEGRGYGAVNRKGPSMKVYTDAEQQDISKQHTH